VGHAAERIPSGSVDPGSSGGTFVASSRPLGLQDGGWEQFAAERPAILDGVTTLDEREGPRDECGVFGIFAPGHEVSGQESAGIAAADVGGHIMTLRDLGLVNQVFDEQKLRALGGDMAVGHVRYSTTGSNGWDNAQPVHRSDRRELALGHNGNLINAVELHAELRARGVRFRSTSDSEIIAALLASHEAEHIEDAVTEVLPRLQGAFSTVLMTKDTLVAFRDPAGLRRWCSAASTATTASRASPARWTSSAPSSSATCVPAR